MDEELKQKVLVAAVAFNLTVVAYQVLFNSASFSMVRLFLAFLLGAVIGGIAFGVMHFLQNRQA